MLSLITLTFQNSALMLVMHYSRIMPPNGDHRYFTSTAVFLNELIKLSISLTLAMYETSKTLAPSTPATVLFEQIYNSVFNGDGWKLAVPAALYTFQNLLQYVAIGNLDAVQFQVLYQLKILTTALFSVILLRRSLGLKHWGALIILTLGVCVVSLPPNSSVPSLFLHDTTDHFFPRSLHELGQASPELYQPQSPQYLSKRDTSAFEEEDLEGNWLAEILAKREEEELAEQKKRATTEVTRTNARQTRAPVIETKATEAEEGQEHKGRSLRTKRSATYEGITEDLAPPEPLMNYSLGVTSVLIAAAVSGFTGVYFEKLLKESPTQASVWVRNIQLSLYSLVASLFGGVFWQDGEGIREHGFFEGYNWVVWTAIGLQAVGGLVASMVIRDADNIVKNFATSISIVISFLASVMIFDFAVTWTFLIGTGLVLLSTYIYSLPNDRKMPGQRRPPPIRIASLEKTAITPVMTPRLSATPRQDHNRLSLLDPLETKGIGLTSSRPASPMLPRTASKLNFKRDE